MTKSIMFTWEDLKPNPTKVGARREVARFPTTNLAEFESHITTLNPGEKSHDPHTHVNEEILILKEGTAEAYVNGEWKPMTTGSMVLMGSMVPHAIRNAGKTPCTYYVINWKTKTEGAASARRNRRDDHPAIVPAHGLGAGRRGHAGARVAPLARR